MNRNDRPRSRRAAAIAIVIGLASALSATACKSKAGDACTAGQAACFDGKTALVCARSKLVPAACAGPDGCVATGGTVSCDIRGDTAGEPCLETEGHPMVCAEDGKARFQCKDGKVARDVCNGPRGCEKLPSATNTMACDHIAAVGDACSETGDEFCAADGKSALTCKGGKMALASLCRGPNGCKMTLISGIGTVAACDIANEVGDPCTGGKACSADKKAMFSCKDGKLAFAKNCRGPGACAPGRGDSPDCDDSIAEVGEECNAGSKACAVSGKSVLACRDAKLVVERDCSAPQTCATKGATVACARN